MGKPTHNHNSGKAINRLVGNAENYSIYSLKKNEIKFYFLVVWLLALDSKTVFSDDCLC